MPNQLVSGNLYQIQSVDDGSTHDGIDVLLPSVYDVLIFLSRVLSGCVSVQLYYCFLGEDYYSSLGYPVNILHC